MPTTDENKYNWGLNEESKLLCAGRNNVLLASDKKVTTIKCLVGKVFMVNGRQNDFKHLICKY